MTTNKQLTLPGELVKKSNQVVRSKMRLDNVYTARVFTSIIASIKEQDSDFKEYRISASAVIHSDNMGGKAYKLIKQALKTIISYTVELPLPIEDEQDEKEKSYALYPLFAKAQYCKGTIIAQIHPDLKPHFLQLGEHFTQYPLIDYLLLSGTYSQRIYEILNSYNKLQKYNTNIEISLADLHHMLNTPESLQKRFPDFRRKALEPAHKEINEKTDLEYEWLPVKLGRNIVAINFIFSKSAKEEAQKIQSEKDRKQLNKYVKQALDCFKERYGKPALVDGKCTEAKPKTKKCIACKRMGYFAV